MSLLQKLSSSWLVLLVLVMVLLALCLDTTEARKKSGKKFKAGGNEFLFSVILKVAIFNI